MEFSKKENVLRLSIFGDRTGRRSLRNIHFTELALKINPLVETESNLRRIQIFFSDYDVNYRVIAVLLTGFIDQNQCRLSIDRTNWKFGIQDINFLVLTVYYKEVGIPILFNLLDKKGNSNHQERIDILGEFIEIFEERESFQL